MTNKQNNMARSRALDTYNTVVYNRKHPFHYKRVIWLLLIVVFIIGSWSFIKQLVGGILMALGFPNAANFIDSPATTSSSS